MRRTIKLVAVPRAHLVRQASVILAAIALVAGAVGVTAQRSAAQPSVPATFFGSASIDGEPVPESTDVRAFIGEIDCTQAAVGERGTVTQDDVSAYGVLVVHESQRPGCGTPGEVVTFTIDGQVANETGLWQATAQGLDLNAGEGTPLPLPRVTATPPVGDIDAGATATAEARFTPLPATALPTDDPSIRVGVATGAGGSDDDGGSTSLALPLTIGLVVLAVLGTTAGVAISRRRSRGGPS